MLSQVYCGGPNAIIAAKRQISLVAHAGITEGIVAATADALADIRATSEAQEGLTAFLEKRKAAWIEPGLRKKRTPRKR